MTNNINQQKFNVLLKNPKDQVKIMTQIDFFLFLVAEKQFDFWQREKINTEPLLDLGPTMPAPSA